VFNIAVFASGRGSNFRALFDSLQKESVEARIVLLISNNSNAGAMEFARSVEIRTLHASQKIISSQTEFASAMLSALRESNIDLIVLAGYMKKLAPEIVAAYRGRIINIHPALLPEFGGPGMYGHHVHEAVLRARKKNSGATVHYVDEEFDHGNIILQERVSVLENDTPELLAERVLEVEHRILPMAVKQIADAHLHHNQG
jgi:phosphoribosylglycinamide formyltransferase-1